MQKIIEVSFTGGKKIEARLDERVIQTDQKKINGGDESAPTPFQLFLSSLATCSGIYALNFCHARNIPTDGMAMKMICDFSEEKKFYTKMTFSLVLPPGFPEKHKSAIIRAIELCTVKRLMQDPPEFQTILEESSPL